MEKLGVILYYRPDTWPKVFDYNWYFLTLNVTKLSHIVKGQLKTLMDTNLNVTYYYKSIGASDWQIELRVKSRPELHKILLEFRSLLKSELKHFELLIILEELKYTYFPDCMLDTIIST